VYNAQLDVGLFLLRVVAGSTMAAHGYNKFFGGGRIAGTARWFDSIGMKPGKLQALLAASTEVGAGLLLALGLFTPLAGAAFVALMAVASYTVHRGHGFFVTGNGWEYNLVLATIGVALAATGPGRWSVDHAIGIDVWNGWWAPAIAAVGGLAAAAVLLGLFFRPPIAVHSGDTV
jgi:putative oxidoreductase